MTKGRFDVAVVGAGVFGCWSALTFQKSGLQTLLIDAWGVAHPRASSGGESRIIRTGYGRQTLYTGWAWDALAEWKALGAEVGAAIFVPCGVLWLGRRGNADLKTSRLAMDEAGVPYRTLSGPRLAKNFPAFELAGIDVAVWEPECGALLARQACRHVATAFLAAGGTFRYGLARTPLSTGDRLETLRLDPSLEVRAERFVFCLGPWMGSFFPELLGSRVSSTRQEVFFFGTPGGREDFFPANFPAWIDISSDEVFYGLPVLDGRGVKVACDSRGASFDPTSGPRESTPAELEKVRGFLARRLPQLADAPVVETRVCQYEQTPDSDLIIDRHPRFENVWLAGGGSGHGFKLGPSVGKQVARLALQPGSSPPREVALARLAE